MKIKCRPEDFRVEEIAALTAEGGDYALYRLRKKNLGTPEAIDGICRRFNISRDRVSFGGLKDRHAMTEQYITILGGPETEWRKPNLQLKFLGKAGRPFVSDDIVANRFELVVRDLGSDEIAQASADLPLLSIDGVANYFDDQRFGSVGRSGEFAAEAWCKDNLERTLWLAIADANENDRPRDASDKRWLRQRWGDWRRLVSDLSNPELVAAVECLAEKPDNFARALASLRHDRRSLLVSAYQSHLWNLVLSHWIEAVVPDHLIRAPLKTGEFSFYRSLNDSQRQTLRSLVLPLPSARSRPPEGPILDSINAVLQSRGMRLEDLRIRRHSDTFFSKGDRPAIAIPAKFELAAAPDEMYEGRHKATFRFELPRGAYATMILKRLFPAATRRHVEEQKKLLEQRR